MLSKYGYYAKILLSGFCFVRCRFGAFPQNFHLINFLKRNITHKGLHKALCFSLHNFFFDQFFVKKVFLSLSASKIWSEFLGRVDPIEKKIKCIAFKRKGCDAYCQLYFAQRPSFLSFSLHCLSTSNRRDSSAAAKPSLHQAEEGKEGGRDRRSLRKTCIQLGRGSPQIFFSPNSLKWEIGGNAQAS
jgi:hypothetical protein